jgi:hypothetical protein
MAFEKAGYWIAVGVLALFVSNHVVAGHENVVRGVANRSLAVIEQVSGDATHFMTTAEVMLGRGGAHFAQTQTTLGCAQSRLASVQTVIAQHQAVLARVEAQHARIAALQELRSTVMCPRERLTMHTLQPLSDGSI